MKSKEEYGHKGVAGAYDSKKGGAKAKDPFKSKKMPKNAENEVKPSHKGYAK